MKDHHPEDVDLELGGNEAAGWLHYCAICYCSRNLSDGFVPSAALSKLTSHRSWRAHVQALVKAGWFIEVDGGVQIRGYLDHQSSRAEVEARKEANRRRQAKSRGSKASPDAAAVAMTTADKVEAGLFNPPLSHPMSQRDIERTPRVVTVSSQRSHDPSDTDTPTESDNSNPQESNLLPFNAVTPQPVVARVRHHKDATPEQREAFDALHDSLPDGTVDPDRFKDRSVA